ncbi:MAG: Rpp14/Pop5 family protein [Methanosarcinaceae archaeon]|nr:Rpp14/Pop5 family protein [Methanosarcinaceae archaeon]MDD4332322.1 Rpp14/Pop5 family protein [Methanosarcinaceae archaeon]MDD4749127.1 Rpp14/Pop5 family protein [Methanosarcinaceae archaeon]
MKRLLPSLRPRKRYLAIELISNAEPSRGEFSREIYFAACSLLGDAAVSECDLKVLGFEAGLGIIQCAHTKLSETRAALAALTQVNRKKAAVHVLGVSGTIKGATEKFLEGRTAFKIKAEHLN